MIPLSWWDEKLKQFVSEVLAPVIKKIIDMIFQPILDAIAKAVELVMGTIGTFWVYVKTPAVGDYLGRPANDSVGWIWNHTSYIAIFVAVIGILVGAIQMAWSQRGEAARDILRSLITLGVASALCVG